MPKLYLAKVNLNAEIFSVYEEQLDLNSVLKTVYEKIEEDKEVFNNPEKSSYTDADGNTRTYKKDSRYSFAEIEKHDGKYITGKIVRNYIKPNEQMNETTKKVEVVYKRDSVAIRFYFSVYDELLTFCERQNFGYNQFMNAFNQLLNRYVKSYKFETFLQKDRNKLDEKLKELVSVQKVKVVLIPPNPNGANYATLKKRCIEINATKVRTEYESENVNMQSDEITEIQDYISNGYGDMTIFGRNKNGHKKKIYSSSDAAFSDEIAENLELSEFCDESKNLILRFKEYVDKRRK